MTRRRGMPWLALLLCVPACGPAAPWTTAPGLPIDLRIAVAPTQVALLQPIDVVLDLFVRDGVEVEWAPRVDAADFLATTETMAAVPVFDGSWRRTRLSLKPVRGPGELVVPSFTCRQKGGTAAASTEPQRITVVTAKPDAPIPKDLPALLADGLDPVGAPFPTPVRWWPWLLAGAALAGFAAGLRWWRGRVRAVQHALEVAVPAHVRALRELQRLQGAPRTTRAEVERFYVDVSAVLREYLEGRFGLRAPERTTEEFLRELEAGDALARGHRRELEHFLSQCDLVKFAAHEPPDSAHVATWQSAVAFVETTRADRVAASVPAEVRA